ncbi:DUF4234 domain-containing protein [Brachyspira hampsonii]|uniref:DUF4234 domain-containing protein n=1 Tax=Brachyspira hampsonii TaxID=1287055 RepID=A0AAC9XKB4_9SPIR|nr:DUF4234 domain-containing protein [Brachyspira hampsonii]ASJ21236.1 hypothetical protein BHAMNSH16_06035 [Brachyspira hampsonii]ELV05117.1 hypothetical protein H263_12104 [Brachyspira hampsonii 30599]MBW5379248.1 DUF4234 domain-containing protein [Brachyspira hampsonii]MBW5410084.1 DUF4234 domain-containing protein [Brachyspira hampsonii]OEJ17583.1 hypothetical protein A9496_11000 [Brachyspira hampsonii]
MKNFQPKPLLTVAILSIVTCGIYFIYWIYVTTNDVNNYMEQEYINPTLSLVLSIITCGLFSIYWFYKYGTIVFNDMSKKAELDSYGENAAVLAILLFIPFGYIYSIIALQSKLNIIFTKYSDKDSK